MGLLGFLQFLITYSVDVIAWPLLALAFPLFASIRAIELNSFADSQKLNTYWVVFSLILLLEHVLSLFQWFPFWHYLRLIIVCLLVIPYFDGAFYVYKQVTSSLLSMDARMIINWFNKPKVATAETEKILAKVEKYVRENGAEALEEIIADKSGSSKDPDVKDIKAVPSIDNEVVNQPNSKGPYVARKGIEAVEEIGKNGVKTAMLSGSTKDPNVKENKAVPSIDDEVVNQPNSKGPYVARKGIKAVEDIEKNEVKAAILSGSTKDPDVKENKAVPSIDDEVVNQPNSSEPYVARKDIKAVEEIGKNEVKVAMLSGSTKDPDIKENKAVPSIDDEVVNQPNSEGPYVARKGIKAVEDIEKNEVKAAMLSGSTKDPDVKENKAVPSIDDEVVNQPNSNEPYVARKGIKAVAEIGKNEVKAAMMSGSTKDPDVKETSIENEVVNQPNSNDPYVARKGIKAVEEIGKNEVKAAMMSGSTEDPDVKENKAVPSIDDEVVNQPNSKGPYVARKGIKAVEDIEKNEVKAAMLSGSTKDPDVKEIKAVPSVDNEVVNEATSNGPNVARKDIQAVEEIEKNEVKAAMQVSRVEPEVTRTKNITIPSETSEKFCGVQTGGELPQTPVSNIVQTNWECAICKKTFNSLVGFDSHLRGKKHKRAMDKAVKAKNETLSPKTDHHSAVEDPGRSSNNQTVFPKVIFSDIPKQFDQSSYSPGNIFNVSTSGWEPSVISGGQSDQSTYWPGNISNVSGSGMEPSVISGGQSGQSTYSRVNISNVSSSGWEPSVISGGQSDRSTYWPGNNSNVSSSRWEPTVISGGQSDPSTYSPGNISNVSSSRWEPNVISGGQSDQSTYWPGNIPNVSSSGWEPSFNSGGQSDQFTYLPGNISTVSSSGWDPSFNSGGQSDQFTYSPGNISTVSSSGWDPSVISGGQSDQSTYLPGNISNVSSSGWDPSVISGGQSDQSTYWLGNMFNESSSGWEPSVTSGGQSGQSTYWPGNISNVSSSGWEPSVIAGERFQGKPKNVVPGEKPMKQKKATVGPNDSSLWCEICNVRCEKANMKSHRRGKKHLTQLRSLAKK